ncbi:carbohydrate ABC transporter permease [Streptomyces fructofermentans]|uniref:carbohydrate ABC transporter permease n=1 Tax=Streptomyces fructofermentans TaxID=152141 RepID=UPI003401C9FF
MSLRTALPLPTGRRTHIRWPGAGPLAGVLALTALAVLFLVPVYVMVMAGMKPPAQADAAHMWELPKSIDFSGLEDAWAKLGPNLRNSFEVVIPATVISSAIGSLNGFVLAKFPFRGSTVLFAVMLLGMFIPYQVILVPLVRFLQSVGLYGTLTGLTLVHVIYGIPITTLIFRNYYGGIPDEIIEAAQVDGASNVSIFWRLFLPLSVPGFVVCGIFQFTNVWNDFLFGITVVPDPTQQPVTVALNNLAGNFSVQWNTVMAGALVAAVPTAIVYLLLGRFFVRGLTAGSVK